MRNNREKTAPILDYAIGILMITILTLATFLMPQAYSALMDNQDLNQVHAVEREDFSFENLIEMTVYERIQQMMEKLSGKTRLRRTLYLSGAEVTDQEFIEGVRESLSIVAQYELIPDVSTYDLENNIVYAEYYNLSDGTAESTEIAFWEIHFSDNATFEFIIWVDANDYILYQAEMYCKETDEICKYLTSTSGDVVSSLNNQFMERSESYFEAEGYEAVTDVTVGNLFFRMGYERGEYASYRIICDNSTLKKNGIRWGFVPMTIALEGNSALAGYGVENFEELLLGN